MELHDAIPLPDNSIDEKKKNSIRIAQEKCTFQEIRCRKKKSSSEVGYFSDRLCVLHRPK